VNHICPKHDGKLLINDPEPGSILAYFTLLSVAGCFDLEEL